MRSEIKKWRKKPVEVEARFFDCYMNAHAIAAWCGGKAKQEPLSGPVYIDIPTLEGVMRANVGDFVIKGVKGEFYPCKADIFCATYEEVESPKNSVGKFKDNPVWDEAQSHIKRDRAEASP